ncbi:hypothetical protein AMECASPLE_030393 [Ameca splendens]|uniref:Uncharacterized protein n=1 Tax=Ameca splendens TaxID=208324 RepID=A0ABV0YTI9_9TELE
MFLKASQQDFLCLINIKCQALIKDNHDPGNGSSVEEKTDQVKPWDLVFLSCLWFITAGYVRTAGRAKIDVQNKENMSSLSIPRTGNKQIEAVLTFLAHQL